MPRFGAGRWAAIAAVGVLGFGSPALAQSGSPVAEALFNEARAFFNQGRYDEACPKFRESDRLEPALGSKLNLAMCEEARGRLSTAWVLFRVVIEKLPPDDPRRTLAEQHRRALDPRLPRVTVRLTAAAPPDTSAELGDAEISGPSFGTPLAIDPGPQSLVVRAPGRAEATFPIVAVEGQAIELDVEPGPAIVAPPPAPSGTSTPGADQPAPRIFTPLRIGAVAAGGLGVLSFVLTGAFSAHAASKDGESTDLGCTEDDQCPPAAKQARLDALAAADRATVAAVFGSVLVAGGAVLWFVGAPKSSVQAGAVWTPGRAEVAVRGSLP